MKNIWYVSKYAIPSKFGSPTRQFLFSKFMAKHDRNVTLICSRSVNNNNVPKLGLKNHLVFCDENVECVLLNGPLINLGFNLKRIYSWIIFEVRLLIWAFFSKKEKPDVIIVSSLSLLTFCSGIILKKWYKCKLVCEVRDIWPLTIIEAKNWKKNNILIRFLSYIEKEGYKRSDLIIGSMPNLKEHVEGICKSCASKVKYIPTGFDSEVFKELDQQKSNAFVDFPKNSFIVGYAGTIGFINCIDHIIDAARLVKSENIHFVLLGNGPLKEVMKEKTKLFGLSNVTFYDAVPKEQVNSFLNKCDLLLNPCRGNTTLYKYGLSPNKWIDYMYSGKPILVSLDGFPSILDEAQCGKFIPADKPETLAKEIVIFSKMEKKILEQMGENGRNYLFTNISYSTLTDTYLELIDNC